MRPNVRRPIADPSLLSLMAALLMSTAASGQEPGPTQAAEAVVQEAFEELEAARFENVAALVHPSALARFRSIQLEQTKRTDRYRSEAMARDPEMPEEVAEWFEQRQRRFEAERGNWIEGEFAGVTSVAELEALSAEDMLARWLRARDARELFRSELEARGQLPDESRLEDLLGERRTVLGSILQDDTTVVVVYQTQLVNHPIEDERLAVATVRKAPEGWRLWTTWQDPRLFDSSNLGFWIETEEERIARLEEIRDRPFAWPEDGDATIRAAIQGYEGDGMRPNALALELRNAEGHMIRVDLPFEALVALWQYLEPWLFLPER